jgi:hypothetical protein
MPIDIKISLNQEDLVDSLYEGLTREELVDFVTELDGRVGEVDFTTELIDKLAQSLFQDVTDPDHRKTVKTTFFRFMEALKEGLE